MPVIHKIVHIKEVSFLYIAQYKHPLSVLSRRRHNQQTYVKQTLLHITSS